MSTLESYQAAMGNLPAAPTVQIPAPASRFVPAIPKTLAETGLAQVVVEELIFKIMLAKGAMTGRELAMDLCLHFSLVETILADLKSRLLVLHKNNVGMGDFVYMLSEVGQEKAMMARDISAYAGAVPVRFETYLEAVKAQSIRNEKPDYAVLSEAFRDMIFDEALFDTIGPAINSGRGLFLYGEPGNGKTSIAEKLALCFNNDIFIPKSLFVEGQILQLYDPQNHDPVPQENPLMAKYDQRWMEIKRPAVMVGGELMMDALEIKYNPILKISEAPLQMKANGGVFLIDDFGRQRVSHIDLLNRWIVPLEKRMDFLVLPNGQKIEVPFDELIIFSTNLDPKSLVDDAFLRRIPYKIHVKDPSEAQFRQIFKMLCEKYQVAYDDAKVSYLIQNHYVGKRPFRGCQPRDILEQILNAASYQKTQPVLTEAMLDMACRNYFAAMGSD
ncbi:AAA family ATPase [Vampirovibrio sp.]|uniref:AAA family ATPase n=1 Tax=Vampirovibrio sp. TaxID=2717857 RepID=UPI0035941D49